MEQKHKFSLIYVLLVIWLIFLVQSLLMNWFAIKHIPYSQFINAAKEGQVKEVTVSKDRLKGTMITREDGQKKEITFDTVRVDPDISDLLKQHDVTFRGTTQSEFLQTLFSWLIPIALFVGIWFLLMRQFAAKQSGFLNIGKNKAKIYMEDDLNTGFKDAAGVDEAKQELEEIIDFLKRPDRYTRLGGKIPKGILMVGPSGTGKTLLSRAVAGESEVPFFTISGSEFVEMFVGMGAARVRDLFSQAKQKAPCIIFIDELDALGKARGMGGMGGGHDEREQTLNQLLVEMDGFDPTIGVILMAATNQPEVLDPALLRPGRFDRHILVDRPDKKGRLEILDIHARSVNMNDDVDLETVAGMTPGFVGADLANLVNEAVLLAVRRNKEAVAMADFQEAVERIIAGLEKRNRVINEEERRIIAHHECGHALVALSLPKTDPVRKISIIPRGVAALGYTQQVPTEDRFLMSREELLNRIAVTLGGRAAETVHFQSISTGAHDDLAKATDIARSMVKEYGMSERLGQSYFEDSRKKNRMLGSDMLPGEKDYSESTAKIIDEEIKAILDTQYNRAMEIIQAHHAALEEGAQFLLEEENIYGGQLKEIMNRHASG
ncbi:MAG: ATP-dependent zinc metalloprotease FtsH [Thermodesulfobacteriota bacterium]|nr:ATP-dependent zinc metalloprotease FtsH [Thermodesulfobacteriota bacterium]